MVPPLDLTRVGICNPTRTLCPQTRVLPLHKTLRTGLQIPSGGVPPLDLTRVGICNPDPNDMSTNQSPAVAQNVSDGIKNPVRRSVGRIQGCDPPKADDISITYGGTRPWFRPTDLRRIPPHVYV